MDGVDAAGISPGVVWLRIEAREDEGSVPVLGVDYIGHETEVGGAGEQRITIEEEALDIVFVSVDLRAAEVTFVFDEVDRHAPDRGLPEADALVAVRPEDVDIGEDTGEVRELRAVDGGVHGERDADIDIAGAERSGEGADDIAEATDLRERAHFDCGEEDLQCGIPSGKRRVGYV